MQGQTDKVRSISAEEECVGHEGSVLDCIIPWYLRAGGEASDGECDPREGTVAEMDRRFRRLNKGLPAR